MGIRKLTMGSLFNGISGWILAGERYGVKTLWESEVEKFCEAVTAHHFPEVKQLGDITKIDGAEIEPVDIICAGSPCQDLSIAGKQEGLKGDRSGLFLRAVDIVRRMRRATNGEYPRYFVWENVPGAFSSNRGLDFRAVLEEISQTEIPMPKDNKWANAGVVEWGDGSLAWRVLDAQYWGVPQRRKRIFLVADFGGRSAGEILFECESVPRDSATGGETREGTAAGIESGVGGASGACMTPWDCQSKRIYKDDGVFPCLQSTENNGEKPGSVYVPDKARSLTARNDGSLCVDRGPDIVAAGFKHKASPSAGNIGYKKECAPTLMEGQESAVVAYDMTHADEVMRPDGGNGKGYQEDVSYTLNTMDRHAVAAFAETSFGAFRKDTVAGTQKKSGGGMGGGSETLVCEKSVRRLTPLEAERLQGLPDNYTLIDDKSCSDSARYKALGNGMAQPVANWVIKRIKEVVDGDGILEKSND